MNFVQEVLNLLVRKQDKDKLELTRDWFEFGRTKTSRLATPAYSPKMTPHAIRYDDLKCNIISGLVEGTGTEHTLPMWSTVNENNCSVQTIVDSIFSQDPAASEGLVSGDFRVSGNTVLEGDLLVLGTQTIVESTVVQVADNIFRINSTGAPLDSGIEVVVPAGIKTWAWDNARGLWSTFGEDMATRDANISGALRMDGENLVNVVNEAEGLASNDNDESLATVAAIKDYVDSQAGAYVVDVQLIGDDLQFTGVGAAFSGTVNLSKYLDNTDTLYGYDVRNNGLNGGDLRLLGSNGTIDLVSINPGSNVTLAVNEPGRVIEISAANTNDIDYVSDVQFNGFQLEFTGVGNAFTGPVDLSDLDVTYDLELANNIAQGGQIRLVGSNGTLDAISINPGQNVVLSVDPVGGVIEIDANDTNDIDYISDVQLIGTDLQFTGVNNGFSGTVSLASLGGGGMALSDIVAGDKINVSVNGVNQTVTVSHQTTTTTPTTSTQSLTYGATFDAIVDVTHDAYGHITGYDTRTFTMPLSSGGNYTAGAGLDLNANEFSLTDVSRTNSSSTASPTHSGTFTVIDDITTNAKGQVTAVNVKSVTLPTSGTGADGVITNVTFDSNTSVLDFTGSNGGFNGSINLASLATTETLTSLSRSNDLLLYTDENGNVTNVDLSDYDNPDQNLWANIAVAGQQTITANTTTDTLEFVAGTGIQLQTNTVQKKVFITNTVTDTNDIDYISDVVLNGTNLDFTSVGNAFAGSVDLSSFLDDTNATYSLGLVASGSNDTVVKLTGAGGGADSQFTIAGGSGITVTENLSTNTIAIASTITNTNDIDYVSDVVLNGTNLDFTGVGNAFGGSIDLSSFLDDTDTTYTISNAQNANDADIVLTDSNGVDSIVTLVAGNNISLTANGVNGITIDATGGGSSYTFGTYLTETSGTVNHDATSRTDTTSAASPGHGQTFTVVDDVSTNATGHVDAVNVKTITLPNPATACFYNDLWIGSRTINTTTFNDIDGSGGVSLGYRNVSGKALNLVVSWTIMLEDIGGGGSHGWNTRLEHFDQGGNSIATVVTWQDSQSLSAEYPVTRTYTGYIELPDQEMVIAQIAKPTAIAPDFTLLQANMNITVTECVSANYGEGAVRA